MAAHAIGLAGIQAAVGADAGLIPDHGTNPGEIGLLVKFGKMDSMQFEGRPCQRMSPCTAPQIPHIAIRPPQIRRAA